MASKERPKPVQAKIPPKDKARWDEHADKYYHGNTTEFLRQAAEAKIKQDVNGEPGSKDANLLPNEIQNILEILAKKDEYVYNTKLSPMEIIECLDSTNEMLCWKVEDIQELYPASKEKILNILRDDPEMFQLIPGNGWKLRAPDDWDNQ